MWMGLAHLLYVKARRALTACELYHLFALVSIPRFLTEAKPRMELCIMREELVTRTGFEPMLKA